MFKQSLQEVLLMLLQMKQNPKKYDIIDKKMAVAYIACHNILLDVHTSCSQKANENQLK